MAKIAFNAAEVEPMQARTEWEPGVYMVTIANTEEKQTKSGNGTYISMEYEREDGRKIWDNLNVNNPSEKAVEIATRTLSAICRACGVMTISDTDELIGRAVMIDVRLEKRNDTGELQARIKGYSAPEGAAPAKPAARPAAKPAARPAAKPAAKPAMPWMSA